MEAALNHGSEKGTLRIQSPASSASVPGASVVVAKPQKNPRPSCDLLEDGELSTADYKRIKRAQKAKHRKAKRQQAGAAKATARAAEQVHQAAVQAQRSRELADLQEQLNQALTAKQQAEGELAEARRRVRVLETEQDELRIEYREALRHQVLTQSELSSTKALLQRTEETLRSLAAAVQKNQSATGAQIHSAFAPLRAGSTEISEGTPVREISARERSNKIGNWGATGSVPRLPAVPKKPPPLAAPPKEAKETQCPETTAPAPTDP